MAPEQAAADPDIDHRVDIYALGVLAYEMLTGPHRSRARRRRCIGAHISTAPAPLGAGVPPAIAAIVTKCLAKHPDQRYQSAEELLLAIESLVTPGGTVVGYGVPPAARRRRLLVGALGAVALGVVGVVGARKVERTRWVHETAIPEMRRMIDDGQLDSAWYLGREVAAVAPDDSLLHALSPGFARMRMITTRPEGVEVSRASLADTSRWTHIGTTPFDSVLLPTQLGMYRLTRPGYFPLYYISTAYVLPVVLDSTGTPDPEMITIAGGDKYGTFLVGTDGSQPLALRDWKMDRYETSNREFRAFIEAGGYRDSTWWLEPVRENGRTLSRAEAMARFVDQTGRPGPSTWVAGDYPAGQGDMPVGGVSWYEAAAYAKWKGKSLPTIYHWASAANVRFSRGVVPESNLEGTGPWAVGKPRAVSLSGVSDLAGNVREWNQNEGGRELRFILGGGWSDPTYAFVDAYAQPPMDRSAINGIRLVRYDPADTNVAVASRPIPRAFTDWFKVPSVSDAVFQGFRTQFDYDPLPLEARVERTDSTSEEWTAEFVSFTAAYGKERMQAWVFLPKHGTPPYQTVVYFPGSGAINTHTSAERRDMAGSFVVKSGRAFVLPIYKSTYERTDSITSDIPNQSIFWRDHVVMWAKDFRRALDYLSSRPISTRRSSPTSATAGAA